MESVEPLLRELTAIKWLLVFMVLGVAAIVGIFFFLALNIISVMRDNRRDNAIQSKHNELEDLLASGQNMAAKFSAIEWVGAQPRRPEAHWALAKAHYQLGELSEAKQILKGLLKFAPDEHYRIDAWLDLIEEEFAQKKLKPVD